MGVLRIIRNVLLILLETVLLLVVALYGVMLVICKGPSPTAGELFVLSVRETSAVGFLANLFYTEEEITQIETRPEMDAYTDTDPTLVAIATPAPEADAQSDGPQPDAWGLVDEDGDGIIVEEVTGQGFKGHMMVVLDPSRVIFASVPGDFGSKGHTVEQMVQTFGGVAGTNAGGFCDPNGSGNGSTPDTMVVWNGTVYYAQEGSANGFAGFDKDHILHVGNFSAADVREREIQNGVSFGPVLIANGEPRPVEATFSGINPRTGIGQRSDGAVLLLVIDGRQITSMGATCPDMVEIFQAYGAVNACNLDGGSSCRMWYEGAYINSSASMVGDRRVPTAVVVLAEGVGGDG